MTDRDPADEQRSGWSRLQKFAPSKATILAFFLGLSPTIVQYFSDRESSYSDRLDSRITELRQSAADLQVLAGDYVTAILNGDTKADDQDKP